MHPAPSVILFTVSSGAGYGALIWVGVAAAAAGLPPDRWLGFVLFLVALGLITIGLLSSLFHLGHPERAWRAVSQWRTSWLSREGVAALLTYIPALLFGAGWVLLGTNSGVWTVFGLLASGLAVLTVVCTGMIYASLKPIPAWNNRWVVPLYLLFALGSGGLLVALVAGLFGQSLSWLTWGAVLLLAVGWVAKSGYWRAMDDAHGRHDIRAATGLGRFGQVSALEAPHTSENYLLREMGFVIARKHAGRLKGIALGCGGAATLAAAGSALSAGGISVAAAGVAVALTAVALVIERWLFFAEARHAVTLFYGTLAV